MRKLKPWPIIVGILVDSLGSFALGVLYFLIVFGMQVARGGPPSEEPLGAADLVVIEILGLVLTALGGFVAGRMAKSLQVHHGIAVGVGALLVWLLIEWVGPSDGLPVWYEAISFIAVVPAGALGGYAAARRANMPLQPSSGVAS